MASIRKRGDTYQIRVSAGYRPDGSKIEYSMTWHADPDKTEKQNERVLQRIAGEFESKVLAGQYLDGERMTLSDYTEYWFDNYAKRNLTETSIANTKHLLKLHVLPELGKKKLTNIKPADLNRLYNDLAEHRKDGRAGGYSVATIRRVHSAVGSLLSQAVKWDLISSDPSKRVSLPKLDKAIDEDQYWTLEQTDLFLDCLDQEFTYQVSANTHQKNEYMRSGSVSLQLKLFFYIAIYCGLRRGEIVALQWDDIDFDKCLIKVNKERTLADGEVISKKPKSKRSIRTITAPDEVIALARKWHLEQLQYRLSIGDKWEGSGESVFITWNGLPMRPETPYKAFKRIVERYNSTAPDDLKLPDIPLHGLRHTNATLQISENVDPETVAKRLGHAKTSTTLDVYAHALDAKDRDAAETLSNVLRRRKA